MVLDVLSKYAWVQPLKAKTGVALVKAFDKILKQGRKPNRLQTEQGKEFYNRTFQRWVKDHGIDHFSTEGDAEAAVPERFNRTLKELLYRYFTAPNTLSFSNQLPNWFKVTIYKPIYKKCTCLTMPCFVLKRFLSVKKTECWSSGKAGLTSTTAGLPVKT